MPFYNSLSQTQKNALVSQLTGRALAIQARKKTLRTNFGESLGKATRYVGDVARGGLTLEEKEKVKKVAGKVAGNLLGVRVGKKGATKLEGAVRSAGQSFRKGYYGK